MIITHIIPKEVDDEGWLRGWLTLEALLQERIRDGIVALPLESIYPGYKEYPDKHMLFLIINKGDEDMSSDKPLADNQENASGIYKPPEHWMVREEEKSIFYQVNDGQEKWIFEDLPMALEHIRAGIKDGMSDPEEGDSYTLEVVYMTRKGFEELREE